MVVGIDEFKKKMESMDNKQASLDYVLNNDKEDEPYETYSLDADADAQKTMLEQIAKRIQKINSGELVNFDLSKELGNGQVGRIPIKDCPETLRKMISASNQPNRKSFKLKKENKNKVVAYVTTISGQDNGKNTQLKVFKKLNLAGILSKNKKRAKIGLAKGEVRGVPEDLVIMSPEAMDVVTIDDTAFVFDERNFHYLFSGTKYLKEVVEKNKSNLDAALEDSKFLIDYAFSHAPILRGIYHLVTRGSPVKVDHKKATEIEKLIQAKTGSNDPIFDYTTSGKLICKESNARHVYLLLARKYGLNLVDDEFLILGSTHPL